MGVIVRIVPFLVLTAGLIILPAHAMSAGDRVVSQVNQRFEPGRITLPPHQPLSLLNDDGTTVHHAYVDADNFSFDSGDQKPGDRVEIVFPESGTYSVLCGVHPSMKLVVDVE